MAEDKNHSVVFEADIPAKIGRGNSTMTVVLTKTDQNTECVSNSSSCTTSSNTLQGIINKLR